MEETMLLLLFGYSISVKRTCAKSALMYNTYIGVLKNPFRIITITKHVKSPFKVATHLEFWENREPIFTD